MPRILKRVVSLFFVFFYTSGIYLHYVPTCAFADIVHDDFDDSSTSNDWSGSTGGFTGVAGTIAINRTSADAQEDTRSLELTYSVTGGGDYCGYYSGLNDTSLFSDTPTNRALSFWAKGLAGNEVFKVELGESNAATQKVLIRDYVNGGVATSWREVNIPLMAFDGLNFNNPRWNNNLAFTYEEAFGTPKSGTVRFDNIRLTRNPDTYLVDSFDDADTDKTSFNGYYSYFENSSDLLALRDTNIFVGDTGASMRIHYRITGTAGGNYVVVEQTINNALNKGQDIRPMTSLHFWARADSGVRGAPVNLYLLDMGNNNTQKDLEAYAPALPSDTWVPINIPLSAFPGADSGSIKMIKWAFEWEDKTGTMWIDAVEFSRGYDLTAPGVPTISSPSADSVTQDTAPTLAWSSVADAQSVNYLVQLTNYEDTDYSDPILMGVTTSNNRRFDTGLANGGRYRWRVAAFDLHGNWSAFGTERYFKIQTNPFDDFNDSSAKNRWNGSTGYFTGGTTPGTVTINRISSDMQEGSRSMEISYNVAGNSDDYSGYYSELNNANFTDTRQYRALSFWVKGLAGGEVFDVEMGESPALTQQVNIRDFLNGGITTRWQQVNVPLFVWDSLNFTNPIWNRNLSFVFEANQGLPKMGTVRIDNIRFITDPETYIVDSYDEPDSSNCSFRGRNYFYGDGGTLIQPQRDPATFIGDTGMSLVMYYRTTGGNYAVLEQTVNNVVGKGQDIRPMTSLHFWTKADSGMVGPPANIWVMDVGNNTGMKDMEKFIPSIPTDTWVPVNIPLSAFSGADTSSLKMIKWAWEYEDKSGTMWLDAVEFSKGYDLTPPNTPVLASPPNNGFVADSTPAFTWTGGTDAQGESYSIQVTGWADTDFSRPVLRQISAGLTLSFAQGLEPGSKYQWRVAAYDAHGNWTGFSDTRCFTVFSDTGQTTVYVSDRGDSTNVLGADTDGAFGGILEAISALNPNNGADTVILFSRITDDSYRLTLPIVPDSGMTIMSFREWNRRFCGQNTDTGGGADTYAKIANSANTSVIYIPNIDNVTISGLILDGDSAAGSSKFGIYLDNSSNDSISLIHAYRMSAGIKLSTSETNSVTQCILSANLNEGLLLSSSSQNNTVIGNMAWGNDSAGISLESGSSGNSVQSNTMISGAMGIHVGSNRNTVADNIVMALRGPGIQIEAATANITVRNYIRSTGQYGVMFSNTAQSNYTAANFIDSAAGAGIYIAAEGTNAADTFEANNITNCTTAIINAEVATFDFRYNWWGSRDEDAVTDSAVSSGGGALTVIPFASMLVDTGVAADTVSPDSTRISVDSTVTGSLAIIRWDTVTQDRDGTALNGMAGFHVYRTVAATSNWYASMIDTVWAGLNDTTYSDPTISAGSTYYYRVTAFDSHYAGGILFLNESWFSDTRTVSVPNETPTALAMAITSPTPGETLSIRKGIQFYVARAPSHYDTIIVAQYSPDSGANWYNLTKQSGDTHNLFADANGETYTFTWGVYANLPDTTIAGRLQIRLSATGDTDTAWDTVTDLSVYSVMDTGRTTVFVSDRGDSTSVLSPDTGGAFGGILEAVAALNPSNGPDTIVIFQSAMSDSYRLTRTIELDSGMTLMGYKEWNRRVNGNNSDTGGGLDTYAKIANSANTATIRAADIDNISILGIAIEGDSATGAAKYGICLSNSSVDTIRLVQIHRTAVGIYLTASETNAIIDNIISKSNGAGILLTGASQANVIAADTIVGPDSGGLTVEAGSGGNIIRNNLVLSGHVGMYVMSDFNTVEDNVMSYHAASGLVVAGGNQNRIERNRIRHNAAYGVVLTAGATSNRFAQNEIEWDTGAGIYIASDGTNAADTFEANNITNCTTAVINAEAATFDFRYNWWGSHDEDAVTDSAVNLGGGALTVMPYSRMIVDTSAAADTISPDSTRISADSTVTGTSATIRWDTVTQDRDGTAMNGMAGFHVYRTTAATSNWHTALLDTVWAALNDTTYTDATLSAGSTYYYRVSAFDSHYAGGRLFLNESWFSDTRTVSTTPTITDTGVLEHFNDSLSTNNWNGATGYFTGATGTVAINRIASDALEGARSLQIDYNSGNDYAGYYSELNNWNPTDTDQTRFFSFWAKGLAGMENCYIELGESPALTQQRPLSDFDNAGLDTVWHEVNIPLMAYYSLNFKNPKWNRNLAFVFSNALAPPGGSVRIDSITVKKYVDTVMAETFDDADINRSSWGGSSVYYAANNAQLSTVRDTTTYIGDTGASLRISYRVPDPNAGDYTVVSIPVNNGAGWYADIRNMTSLHFWIKGDTSLTDKILNIWLEDNGSSGSGIVDLENVIPDLPRTWVPLNIPLSRFVDGDPADTRLLKLIKFAAEYDVMSGTTWVDAIEFSSGYNLTYPDSPTVSNPANGTDTNTTTPVFRWSTVADAQGVSYFVQVYGYSDTDLNDPILSGITTGTDTKFSQALGLGATYQWRVAAFDGHGNWSRFSDTGKFRIVSATAPTLNITSPLNASVSGTTAVYVRGTVSDLEDTPTQITFQVDSSSISDTATIGSDGTWADTIIVSTPGLHTFTAVATDLSGNTTAASIIHTADSGGPVVRFGTRSRMDTQTSITLSGTVSDSKQITELRVTHNSGTVTLVSLGSDSTSFSFSVAETLVPGMNMFVAKATDTSGYVGYDTLYIYQAASIQTAAGETTVALPEGSRYDTWIGMVYLPDTSQKIIDIPVFDSSLGTYGNKWSLTMKTKDTGVYFMVRRAPDTMDLKLGGVELKRRNLGFTVFEFNLLDTQAATSIGGSSSRFASLSLSLTPAASTLGGIDVSSMQLFTLNESAGTWDAVSGSAYSGGRITGTLSHLSYYAIFPDTTKLVAANLSNVIVYPNPFVPNDGVNENGQWAVAGDWTTGVIIDNITDDVTVKIFTLAGREILSTRVQNAGRLQWDAKNKAGDKLASGVYLIHVHDMKGRGSAVRKLAVVK